MEAVGQIKIDPNSRRIKNELRRSSIKLTQEEPRCDQKGNLPEDLFERLERIVVVDGERR